MTEQQIEFILIINQIAIIISGYCLIRISQKIKVK